MSTEARESYFSLVYQHGVDEKRRLSIPAAWRTEQPDAEMTFTLFVWDKGGQPPCLLALPPESMRVLRQKLDALPFADPESETLLRLLGGQSAKVTVDKAGRICLPDQIAKAAGISSEAVLVGMVSRFQIWDPERYEAVKIADQVLKEKAHKQI
jgi:MraZ protein